MAERTHDTLLIGVDFSKGVDAGFMLIGRHIPGGGTEILNSFTGDEAHELYKKLVTMKTEEKENG